MSITRSPFLLDILCRKTHYAPWFFLRLWRFINHLLTYLLTYYFRPWLIDWQVRAGCCLERRAAARAGRFAQWEGGKGAATARRKRRATGQRRQDEGRAGSHHEGTAGSHGYETWTGTGDRCIPQTARGRGEQVSACLYRNLAESWVKKSSQGRKSQYYSPTHNCRYLTEENENFPRREENLLSIFWQPEI